MLHPTHERIIGHPSVQPLFAKVRKGHSAPAPDPAKRKVAITGKKRSQCQPQCRALCIATIVIGDPLAQILPAAGVFRRNADVQEREAIPAKAAVDRDLPGNVSEKPGINPAAWGNDIWRSDNSRSAEQLGLTAQRLKALGLIDKIVAEPIGGAHRDYDVMMGNMRKALAESLKTFDGMKSDALLERRHERLMSYGKFKEVAAKS